MSNMFTVELDKGDVQNPLQQGTLSHFLSLRAVRFHQSDRMRAAFFSFGSCAGHRTQSRFVDAIILSAEVRRQEYIFVLQLLQQVII